MKTAERIVCSKLTERHEKHDLFNPNQHGFRRGRSCLSQLIEHQHRILKGLEINKFVDVIYMDFEKAFDKVDHSILLRKLSKIGIKGKLLHWIGDFLDNRKQKVVVEEECSDIFEVQSGVPQGTVLGPLLFLIFIADIDETVVTATVSMFADDTKLLMALSSQEETEDMQRDLNNTLQWASENNMKFNLSKFKTLRYEASSTQLPMYKLSENQNMVMSETAKDLVITMCNNGRFDHHIRNIVKKSKMIAGWVLRTFATRETEPMLELFKTLVLPHLEYCCIIWNPFELGYIRMIEGVQRSFTARLRIGDTLTYWERLKKLKLYSLERRRERYLIIYVWKIINGLVPNIEGEDKIRTKDHLRLGKLCIIPRINNRARTAVLSIKEGSVMVRGPKLFNSIPKEIRNMKTELDKFKTALDRFLCSIPDQPALPHYYQRANSNSLIDQVDVTRRR